MKLFDWFRRKPVEIPPRQRRREALDRVRQAEARGDTRDKGRALMELRQATHDMLLVESGWQ